MTRVLGPAAYFVVIVGCVMLGLGIYDAMGDRAQGAAVLLSSGCFLIVIGGASYVAAILDATLRSRK